MKDFIKKNPIPVIGGLVVLVLLYFIVIAPMINVWRAEQRGKAKLAEARHTKQIMIETARGEKEAAKLRAEAIQIMGQAAKDFPEYRQQEFISAFGEALRDGNIAQIIYVPTEAGIPVIEPARRIEQALKAKGGT